MGMFIMLLLRLPSYICATASIPMALALHYSGFSMGSLVVFLMCGPATNIATISVAVKQIGKKSTLIYVGSIILCSILSGLLFDMMFPGLSVEQSLSLSMTMLPYPIKIFSAIFLLTPFFNAPVINCCLYFKITSKLLFFCNAILNLLASTFKNLFRDWARFPKQIL